MAVHGKKFEIDNNLNPVTKEDYTMKQTKASSVPQELAVQVLRVRSTTRVRTGLQAGTSGCKTVGGH
jgi:hypothetical protein